MKFFLIILALLVILSLTGYVVYLLLKLKAQKEGLRAAQRERYLRIVESIELIGQAMLSDQCNHSEGVLRLKPLLDVLGKKLSQYPAMWALYNVVEEMPILDERKALARNQRMRLDLDREAAEAQHETQIKQELRLLLADIQRFKELYV